MTAKNDLTSVSQIGRFRSLIDRSSRVLATAVVVSLAAHLMVAALPQPTMSSPEAMPVLSATITEMPPPPAPPPAERPALKRKAKPPTAVIAAPAAAPEVPVPPVDEAWPTTEADAPVAKAEPAPEATPPAPVAEEVPPPPAHPIPPRIDLVYRGFLGTRGFFIGDAVYRLEHAENRYTITTVAQARGLAALFLRGEGRLSSTGTITRNGLQPDIYTAERTSDGRHEAAMFDWGNSTVFLNDHKTAALQPPIFDPLAVLWQFYFVPPGEDETEFNVATTRRVYHAHFRRVGVDTVALPFGEVETEVWERDSGDGNITARVWLAPSLHHVMVKMRLSNGRITGEALLDSIRVDETLAQR
jgi:uncharacterized protein DUF3108